MDSPMKNVKKSSILLVFPSGWMITFGWFLFFLPFLLFRGFLELSFPHKINGALHTIYINLYFVCNIAFECLTVHCCSVSWSVGWSVSRSLGCCDIRSAGVSIGCNYRNTPAWNGKTFSTSLVWMEKTDELMMIWTITPAESCVSCSSKVNIDTIHPLILYCISLIYSKVLHA